MSLLAISCGGGGGSNSGPTAVADSFTVNVGQTLNQPPPGVLSNDSNGSMQAELVGPPPPNHVGAFTLNPDGSFTYVHNGNGAATDSFTYRLVGNGQTSGTATVNLTINQPPSARNGCAAIQDSDPSISVTLPATDPNGNNTVATYTLLSAPTNGSIMECGNSYPCTRSSPFVTYVPAGVRGIARFNFNVSDSGGLGSGQPGTITVLKNGELRIMPLGDSITLGLYDGNANTPAPGVRVAYRRKLFNDLVALNPGYSLRFVGSLVNGDDPNPNANSHEGHDGFTTAQLASGITSWLNSNPPDVVLVHAGTNGVDSDISASVIGMNQLLDHLNTWAGSNFPLGVFVARIIPDTTATRDVQTYNNNVSTNINTTPRPNLSIFKVDQQTGSGINLSGQPNTGNGAFYGDSVHPNQAGYDLMASKWLSDMQASSAMPTCQ